jgi:hypothetical protein
MRLQLAADRLHFVEHRLVDVQPARGVEDERRQATRGRLFARPLADVERLEGRIADDRDVDLCTECRELIDGGGPVGVGRREHRMLTLLRVHAGQLRRRRRLAGTLQADEHDDGRRVGRARQSMPAAAEQRHQLVVDDLDHLVGGRERGEHVLADRLRLHTLDEAAHDLEVDVGLEECNADFAECGLDVVLGQPAVAAQLVEDALQSCAEAVEHRKPQS